MGVKAIQFTGGGEPLMHPDHARILTLARELGLDVALVTNGTLMNQEALDALCGAAWVRVSLDAATEETYSDLRRVRPEHFRRALGAIEDLVAMRDRESNGTLIGVGFVVTNSNHAEIRQAVRLCSDLGVDNVRISGAFTPEGFAYHAAFFERAKEMATGAKMDYERDGFRVFDLYDDRIRDLKETGPDDPFCGYMHLATYIGADLNVYRCCVLAYNRQGLIGSVAHQGFRSLWRSEEKQKAFAGFDARKCPRCMFYSKNRFIKYCMSKDPIHVNFV
jgi:MoaA/NifB/PqqE/SkfB family radical SAM enzyme